MITKIDSNTIEPTRQNMVILADKYNLLVEAYSQAVLSAALTYELYENSYNEENSTKQENLRLHLQMKNIAKIQSIDFATD
jgi:hypothetical protein